MAKVRISKKLLNSLPKNVAQKIQDIQAQHVNFGKTTIKSLMFKTVTPAEKFYAAEGYRYTIIRGEEMRSVEMVSEINLGASGVNHNIENLFALEVGDYMISVSDGYGGFFVTLYNCQPTVLEAETKIEESSKYCLLVNSLPVSGIVE